VAEILGTTVSAVETLLVRGKQNLRRALGALIDED
jgi:DNA-directed RNA polymerase specialized sigma24 family protein